MKRCAVAGFLLLLLGLSSGNAGVLIERHREEKQSISPRTVLSYLDTFKANERAVAIASGKGVTCLALYVFDAHGNCVARDDRSTPQTSDDVAAEWVPIDTTRYDVEIYNGGIEKNIFQLALR